MSARAKENLLLYKERLRVDALPGPHHNSITNVNTMFTILNKIRNSYKQPLYPHPALSHAGEGWNQLIWGCKFPFIGGVKGWDSLLAPEHSGLTRAHHLPI
jgi:hypothetical protein